MQSGNQIRSRIWVKGLLLVIVPCFVDGIGCWYLVDAIKRSEQLNVIEMRQLHILEAGTAITRDYTAALGAAASYLTTGRLDFANEASTDIMKVHNDWGDFFVACGDDERIKQQMLPLQRVGEEQLRGLASLAAPVSPESDNSVANLILRIQKSGLRQFVKMAGSTTSSVSKIVTAEQDRFEETCKQSRQAQHVIGQAATYLIIGNTCLAFLLGFLFWRNIAARLQILVQNAKLLPTLIPLTRRVSGNDELEYLDKILHEASRDLKNSAEQRQYLMQMVAHDIRSPLMSAQVAVEILEDPRVGELSETAQRQVKALKRNISRVTALTNDLLTIDKLESGVIDLELTDVSIRDAAEEAVQTLSALAQKNRLQLHNLCDDIVVKADRGRLMQVLVNLVSNAIKFSTPGSEPITIKAQRDKDRIVIAVTDHGPGINPEDQEKIFSKFYQLDSGGGKGFGLGLAICKLIVEAHRGTIGVISQPNKGCTFWFKLREGSSSADGSASAAEARTTTEKPVSGEQRSGPGADGECETAGWDQAQVAENQEEKRNSSSPLRAETGSASCDDLNGELPIQDTEIERETESADAKESSTEPTTSA